MTDPRRLPLYLALASSAVAFVASVALLIEAWNVIGNLSAGQFKSVLLVAWSSIQGELAGTGEPTVEVELLLLGSGIALASLLLYRRRGGAVLLLLAGIMGVALAGGAVFSIEALALASEGCVENELPKGVMGCLILFSAPFEEGQGLSAWQLWLIAVGGLGVSVGAGLRAYIERVVERTI